MKDKMIYLDDPNSAFYQKQITDSNLHVVNLWCRSRPACGAMAEYGIRFHFNMDRSTMYIGMDLGCPSILAPLFDVTSAFFSSHYLSVYTLYRYVFDHFMYKLGIFLFIHLFTSHFRHVLLHSHPLTCQISLPRLPLLCHKQSNRSYFVIFDCKRHMCTHVVHIDFISS